MREAQGQAVEFTDDGTDYDFSGEAEVGDHAAEDGDLGGVFLAEVGAVGLGGDEELGDYGGYSAKVGGSGPAVEAVAEAFDFNKCGRAGGVAVFDCGGEDDVGAFGFSKDAVGIEGAGVAGEIFVGGELGRVDEDADGDLGAFCGGGADEGCMAGVKRAHGGD